MSISIETLTGEFEAPAEVRNFAHTPGVEIAFGPGVIASLGERVKPLTRRGRVLVVTDAGIREAGHVDKVLAALRSAGVQGRVFDEVRENPTTEDVDRCVAAAEMARADVLIGLGGGSSMDTAKGANFLLTNGGAMADYWGIGKAEKEMLPFVAIPTTAGTGSECQSFALIADAETHRKMACGDRKAAAQIAFLDPELTLTQPCGVTGPTGIDALAHAVETAVCKKRSEISTQYSRLAFALLDAAFEKVLVDPADLDARARMQLGAAYAGTAIENSMLGAAHACANPLTAGFDVVHGEAVGIMLPHVIAMNQAASEDAATAYAELFEGDLVERATQWLAVAGMPSSIAGHGVTEADLDKLAAGASDQWTAQFNPVLADESACRALYAAAL